MKKPSKYMLGQGVVAIGPLLMGETRLIPWRGMMHLTCIAPGVRVLYRKHFRRPKNPRPLWRGHE